MVNLLGEYCQKWYMGWRHLCPSHSPVPQPPHFPHNCWQCLIWSTHCPHWARGRGAPAPHWLYPWQTLPEPSPKKRRRTKHDQSHHPTSTQDSSWFSPAGPSWEKERGGLKLQSYFILPNFIQTFVLLVDRKHAPLFQSLDFSSVWTPNFPSPWFYSFSQIRCSQLLKSLSTSHRTWHHLKGRRSVISPPTQHQSNILYYIILEICTCVSWSISVIIQ